MAGPTDRPTVKVIDTSRTAAIRDSRGTSTAAMDWMGAHWKDAAVPPTKFNARIRQGVRSPEAYRMTKAVMVTVWRDRPRRRSRRRSIRSASVPDRGVPTTAGMRATKEAAPTHVLESVSSLTRNGVARPPRNWAIPHSVWAAANRAKAGWRREPKGLERPGPVGSTSRFTESGITGTRPCRGPLPRPRWTRWEPLFHGR